MLKPLPIGNATFRDIIHGGSPYVDKTRYIDELIAPYKGLYFLSRPRHFRKSLMVSTVEEVFRGNQARFEGLWIAKETEYKWPVHPVIRLDLEGMTQVGANFDRNQRNITDWTLAEVV